MLNLGLWLELELEVLLCFGEIYVFPFRSAWLVASVGLHGIPGCRCTKSC